MPQPIHVPGAAGAAVLQCSEHAGVAEDAAQSAQQPPRVLSNWLLERPRAGLPCPREPTLPTTLQRRSVADYSREAILALVDRLYYDPCAAQYGARWLQIARQRMARLLARGLDGHIYARDERPIAALLLSQHVEHAVFTTPSRHVGFWGYARAEISAEEARALKADWLRLLAAPGPASLSMQVATFNPRSRALAERCGFRLCGLKQEGLDP